MIKDFEKLYEKLHRGYRIYSSKGVGIIKADNLCSENGVSHGFSTRAGGISPAPFDSLNLGLTRTDPIENVKRNFRIFADASGFDYNSITVLNHEHGTNIIRAGKEDCARGLEKAPFPFCDGLVTDDPAVTLAALHADCGAVFLYDPIKKAVGIAHAGWKGTFYRIGQKLTEKMTAEFGSRPENIIAATGPCICADCFEVDNELAEKFRDEFGYEKIARKSDRKKGKAYVDIEAALAIQLIEAGIMPEKLSLMHLCTFERQDLFYSYRRDGINTGDMASFIRLV